MIVISDMYQVESTRYDDTQQRTPMYKIIAGLGIPLRAVHSCHGTIPEGACRETEMDVNNRAWRREMGYGGKIERDA